MQYSGTFDDRYTGQYCSLSENVSGRTGPTLFSNQRGLGDDLWLRSSYHGVDCSETGLRNLFDLVTTPQRRSACTPAAREARFLSIRDAGKFRFPPLRNFEAA